MIRRLHAAVVSVGDVALIAAQARHARDVLRLAQGDAVEVFDDRGNLASGVLIYGGSHGAIVRVQKVIAAEKGNGWTIASAVPKGERADWMVEKLSELGADAFVPLVAARSVVIPQGKNKLERWSRIATESAKQSRRRGVMRIEEPTPVDGVLKRVGDAITGICLSTAPTAVPILSALDRLAPGNELLLLVGPEGGWTDAELDQFESAAVVQVRLTDTILRVETAAIAAGAIVASVLARSVRVSDPPQT